MRLRAVPAFVVALAACDAAHPAVDGVGLHLADTAHDGSGLAYVDLAGALFYAAVPVHGAERVDDRVDDAKFAGPLLTGYVGLDASTLVAASVVERALDGSVTTVGASVRTSSIAAPVDGAHVYFETVSDNARDLHLDAAVIVAGASKSQAHWSAAGDHLVLGAKTSSSVDAVQSFDAAGAHTLAASAAARESAITSDGARVVIGVNDTANTCTLALSDIDGGAQQILATGVSDVRFVLADDDSEVYAVTPAGALVAVRLDAVGGTRTLKQSGVVDIVSARGAVVVYATAEDPATHQLSLGVVARDGSGDTALGTAALDVGFTSDGAFYAFLDGVSVDAAGHVHGALRAFDVATGSIASMATDVRKAKIAAGHAVAFTDNTQHLRVAHVGGAVDLVQISVDTFDVMDAKLVYSVRADNNAGIWIVDVL